jgi:hypothetical protein
MNVIGVTAQGGESKAQNRALIATAISSIGTSV